MDTQLIQTKLQDQNSKLVVKTVLNQPFIERKKLAEQLGFSPEQIEEICQPLIESMVVLELASQATSNIESRVPRKVYLINPEFEQSIKDLL
jgi:predicted transcriptional regulator